jgi:nucleotide-binding universal stress UspA family protein
MPPRLLIAFDDSEAANAAVRAAAGLFPGASGRVLTVFPRPIDYETARQYSFAVDDATLRRGLEALARQAADAALDTARRGCRLAASAGLELEPAAASGGISDWPAFLSAADDIPADAIVCGSRGRGAMARSLLGSTSTSLVHHATRPVLVVPRMPRSIDGPAIIGYDGSREAQVAIERAGRLMQGRSAIVTYVWRSPILHDFSGQALAHAPVRDVREIVDGYEAIFAGGADDVVEEGVARARAAGFEASGDAVESGSGPWHALADVAERRGAAVIVCGSRGRGGVASAVLGSVSSGLVHNADIPTLLVRGGEAGAQRPGINR